MANTIIQTKTKKKEGKKKEKEGKYDIFKRQKMGTI